MLMLCLVNSLGFSSTLCVTNASTTNTNSFLSFTLTDIITLIGIIVTFLAVLYNLYQTGITNNRIQWIQTMRELGAKIVAFNYLSADADAYQDFQNNIKQFILMLNIKGQFDRVVASFVRAIEGQTRLLYEKDEKAPSIDELKNNENYFSFSLQIYLKIEWERVKWESKAHFPGRKFNMDINIQNLINEFIENDPVIKKITDSYTWIKTNEKDSSIEPTSFTGYVVGFPKKKQIKKK